jgi:hypothetical protein
LAFECGDKVSSAAEASLRKCEPMVAHELNVGRQEAGRLPGGMARRSNDPFIVRHVSGQSNAARIKGCSKA